MLCPQCSQPMQQGAVVIHNDALGTLFGSPNRSKHLYFIPQGEGSEIQVADGHDLTDAFHCNAC